MPELPEVETIVRDLSGMVTEAVIAGADVVKEDLIIGPVDDFVERLQGRTIGSVTRRAKNLVFDLGADRMVVNLGMTGRMMVRQDSAPDLTHIGVRFPLEDGRFLIYQDVRRFGNLRVVTPEEFDAWSERQGMEPLSGDFTPAFLHRLSRHSRMAVKPWLMDQKRVVGVGNIYASEALHRARISPRKAARRLTRKETTRLHEAIQAVLQSAIDFRGTTLLDYRDASGERGAFSRELRVYDRAGEPCRVCATPIRRIVQGGRSTFYCPSCQK